MSGAGARSRTRASSVAPNAMRYYLGAFSKGSIFGALTEERLEVGRYQGALSQESLILLKESDLGVLPIKSRIRNPDGRTLLNDFLTAGA
eukprot:758726-Pyramimonas_sp.AAC.1